MRRRRSLSFAGVLLVVAAAAGCGSTVDIVVHLTPAAVSLLPGETSTLHAARTGDVGFLDFEWAAPGLEIRADAGTATVTAPTEPGSYEVTVRDGDGLTAVTQVVVRAPGEVGRLPAWEEVPVERDAVRTARRPTAAGVYLPGTQQTAISWMGAAGHPYIAAYDHTSGEWSSAEQVGDNPFPDYHNYPVMARTHSGHLVVAYGAHDTPLRIARSDAPDRIDEGWTDTEVAAAPAASYPFPVVAADGRVFVFYRETLDRLDDDFADDDRPLRYIVSDDDGVTWQNGTDLTGDDFALGSVDRVDNMDEIYLGQAQWLPARGSRPERVLLSWTLAGGGSGLDSLHDRFHRNVYVAYFRPGDLHFESVAGEDLGTQLSNDEMESDCKAVDTGVPRFALDSDDFEEYDVDYITWVDERADGRPVVVYSTYDGDDEQTKFAVWSGSSWETSNAPFDGVPADMELRGSVLHLYVGGAGGYRSWVMTDDDTFRPGLQVSGQSTLQSTSIESLIEGYRQPLQFVTEGREFSDASDEDPELDVGAAGIP